MKTEPTEALKIIDFWGFFHSDDEKEYVDFDNSTKAVNLAFKEGQSNPKVKQLEWKEDHFDIITDTLYGKYIISKTVSGVAFILYLNNDVVDAFFNLDEAKAFVQADFEERVKECLISE